VGLGTLLVGGPTVMEVTSPAQARMRRRTQARWQFYAW
jgi:hypothetical protein